MGRPRGPGGGRGPTVPSSRPRVDKSGPAVPILLEAHRHGVHLSEGCWGGGGGQPLSRVRGS